VRGRGLSRVTRAVGCVIAVLVVAVAGLAGAATTWAATVPNPSVQGPIEGGLHGYPFNHTLFPLAADGYSYSENEYFFGGTATNLETGVRAPYESRMLVRLPTDPAKFNGTVIVHWLNVSGAKDIETLWPIVGKYLMSHGYGYVDVDAQEVGVCCGPESLKGWDPKRYAALVHPSDEFANDIFSQAIRALRHPSENPVPLLGGAPGVDPMRGMAVKHLVADGASQSATELTTFVNDGYNRGQIDAYTISRGGGPYTDFSTPIWQLNEETQPAVAADNSHFRVWEEAGTAHDPEVHWSYVAEADRRDETAPGTPDPIETACSINRGSVDYSARAQIAWVARYFQTGTMGPSMPRLQRNSAGDAQRDANGLAEGGVRQPFIQAPVAYNAGTGCPLFGTYRGWTPAMIQSLYPTHDAYVSAVKQSTAYDVKTGWLLPEDAKDAVAKAEAFTAPWTLGSCYDTPSPAGDESGALSNQVSSATWNPTFMTVGGTAPLGGFDAALHDANCLVVVDAGL
jgi:Alpha/beta hydrolase domain